MPKSYSGKFWDDLTVGQEFWTGGRTVTEADVLVFSGLTGDFNPLHVDEEFSRETGPFGTLVHDMYLGLLDRLGVVAGTALAFLELHWRFLIPVLVGDTVHARVVVRAKREAAKPDRGIVTFGVLLLNQRSEPVQEGEHVLLLARR